MGNGGGGGGGGCGYRGRVGEMKAELMDVEVEMLHMEVDVG